MRSIRDPGAEKPAKANPPTPIRYSLRSASTGSRRDAAVDGIKPATKVSTTLMQTRMIALLQGRAKIPCTPSAFATIAFTGSDTSITTAIAAASP